MNVIITKSQIGLILEEFEGDEDETLMKHLRRYFPVIPMDNDELDIFGKNRILVDDKLYPLRDNKKRLVNKIFWEVKEDFKDLGEPSIRKTIKKYLDVIKDI